MDRARAQTSAAAPFDAGRVIVSAALADGRIAAAAVRGDRPRGLAAVLAGHPPAEIPDIVRRLFALCGMSQATAATHALRMAGAALAEPDAHAERDALLAERLVEHLRATAIGWSAAVPLLASERPALPAALSAAATAPVNAGALAAALDRLGFLDGRRAGGTAGGRPGSWADRLLGYAAAGPSLSDQTPDPLSRADDAAVLAALDRDGEGFAATPHLPGRRPQTGPAARAVLDGVPVDDAAARLSARFAEIAAAAAHFCGERRLERDALVAAGRLAEKTGWAAVETPRGRLHHLVALDGAGQVARYQILAPTEWNFAPDGPCASALVGAGIGTDAMAQATVELTIARLASLYDPCVECRVEILDADGAELPEAADMRRATDLEVE
ncbi:MAG: nickel-dependent hydrogenase large subunit [Rhodoplanes sp.]|uniref:nickel-dependent hydrogenase large subunit n=1 Tax=Rhodoplanes sp. TaxID=1968906 RepID=UPI0017AEFB57|nr:nickel-dependent hydrogenase large subunit [Rhodoplanes sp.]NVO17795.1 nickel-dependent hydrogenase large subunit [Rhodoplanes sp.]